MILTAKLWRTRQGIFVLFPFFGSTLRFRLRSAESRATTSPSSVVVDIELAELPIAGNFRTCTVMVPVENWQDFMTGTDWLQDMTRAEAAVEAAMERAFDAHRQARRWVRE